MVDKDAEIFKGKTFSSLLEDIYNNSKHKNKQIDILVNELRPLVKDAAQATILVPLIKEYLEIGVKNDEQLVKMAAVWQKFSAVEERIMNLQRGGEILTEDEKRVLREQAKKDAEESLKQIEQITTDTLVVNDLFDEMNIKTDSLKSEIEKVKLEDNIK